jgi:hypothetical protein
MKRWRLLEKKRNKSGKFKILRGLEGLRIKTTSLEFQTVIQLYKNNLLEL